MLDPVVKPQEISIKSLKLLSSGSVTLNDYFYKTIKDIYLDLLSFLHHLRLDSRQN